MEVIEIKFTNEQLQRLWNLLAEKQDELDEKLCSCSEYNKYDIEEEFREIEDLFEIIDDKLYY